MDCSTLPLLRTFFFHHTRVKARVIPCPHQPPTRGDNTVSVLQGSTATPGATKQLLPPDRVLRELYIYIYIRLIRAYIGCWYWFLVGSLWFKKKKRVYFRRWVLLRVYSNRVLHNRIMLSVKQGGIKYRFLSLCYDSTWHSTLLSGVFVEHSTQMHS